MPYHALLKGRASICGQFYVTTTVTAGRRPIFQSLFTGRLVMRAMWGQDASGHTQTLACVVMPDHAHWLFNLSGALSLSRVMQQFKGRAARQVNQMQEGIGSLWQKGFHDHAVRTDESLESIARYVVANPVRAGLVEHIGSYPLWHCAWDLSD